ncbi:hypothetical protein VNI00_010133 [Paramarasmius palmivorus]|uniref:Major facilitator superfamily (MFS) profile domain-containing protein n=1 Tax=Paramarasmius palmivorus TaxID=297713 RepID=A0AAW0CHD0_9AGAR
MRPYIVMVGLFAGLGSFLFGYDTGIITTSIAHDSFKDYMGRPSDAATGAIVATYIAGEAVGAIIQMILGDVLGRKRFMQLMCMTVTVGTVIQTAAQNYAMFLVGRILTGVAVGGLVGTVPIYNSEISPPESRGVIGGLSGYMIGIGGFLANWIGYACGFASDTTSFQWRFPLALQVPPGVILFFGLFILPESPRWLIRAGRDEEAKAAFSRIRGNLTADTLHAEFEDMREQILFEKSSEVSTFVEAWRKYKKRIIIAVAVQTMTSLTGVNVINYYQTTLYKQLGITGHTILLLAGVYGTIGVLINIISLRLVDRFGRVKLLGYGAAGLCVDLIYSALMARFFASSDNRVGKGFAILGIYMFTAIYYLGINSTTWLYGVEILPMFLRSKVTGLASTSHFVVNIAITEAGPSAFANIKENYYYVFVATTFVSAVCVFCFFPETKGRSLEMIAAEFGDEVVVAESAKQEVISAKSGLEELEHTKTSVAILLIIPTLNVERYRITATTMTIDTDSRPKAVDLSHHLNTLSKSRTPSPLKDIIKYMHEPGMISLAGGLPHPSLFPYNELRLDAYTPDADLSPGEPSVSSVTLHTAKYAKEDRTNTISANLQYGTANGSAKLSRLLREFTEDVIRPGFSDFEILLHSGNTDAWSKVVSLLCEPRDYILVEQYTYPSSQALWAPLGCRGVPVPMDKDGIIPEELENILRDWDEDERGGKKPSLLYTVPVGQNPTGATLPLERKKAIYEICVQYDIVICEDDPYYFLQLPTYAPPHDRSQEETAAVTLNELVQTLVPTFSSLDRQGRVIRLETFSKTLGPGNRLGYFVCNPLFAERLLRATEVMTQTPSGWSQMIIEELLATWGHEGYLRWLTGLRYSYAIRRDWMCDILAEHFDVVGAPKDMTNDVVALPQGHAADGARDDIAPLFSFTYPKAGMFLWIKLDLNHNPVYQRMKANGIVNAEEIWEQEFWMEMIKSKVLLTPGSYYTPILEKNRRMAQEEGAVYFRLAYSYETRDDIKLGIQRMAQAFKRNWGNTSISQSAPSPPVRLKCGGEGDSPNSNTIMTSEVPPEIPPSTTSPTQSKSADTDRPLKAKEEMSRERQYWEVIVHALNGKNSRVPKPVPSSSEPVNSEVNQLRRYIRRLAIADSEDRDRMLKQWMKDERIDPNHSFSSHNGNDPGTTSDDEGFDSPSARLDEPHMNRKRPLKKLRTKDQDREMSPSADESDDQDDDTRWRPESALQLSLKPATPTDSDNSSGAEGSERHRPAPPNQQVSSWVDYYISTCVPASYEDDGISQEHSQLLLKNFFCWQGPRNSIVDKKLFEVAMKENDPKYYSHFLLYALYTHTMRYVPQLSDKSHEYTAKTHLLLAAAMSRPSSIPTAQAFGAGMLLLASNHAARGMYAQAWYLTASAVGMIIDLECHSDKPYDDHSGEKLSERAYAHRQMRLRIFWAAYNWDKLLALSLNKKPLLTLEERHPPLPDPKDSDDLWVPLLATDSPRPLFSYPRTLCHEAKCFHEYCRACQFLDEILCNLYRKKMRPPHAQQFVSHMRDRLLEWQSSAIKDVVIQEFDKFTSAPPPHILQLNLLIQLIWILLYRPFYYASSKDANKAVTHAVSTCERTAVKIADIFTLYDSHYPLGRASYVVIFAAFLAATVDLALADRQRAVSPEILHRLELCNRVLAGGSHNIPGMQSSVQSLQRHLHETLSRCNAGGCAQPNMQLSPPASVHSAMSSSPSLPGQNESPKPISVPATISPPVSEIQLIPGPPRSQPSVVTRVSSYSESPPHAHNIESLNGHVYPSVQVHPIAQNNTSPYHPPSAHVIQQPPVHHGYSSHPHPPQDASGTGPIMTPFIPYSVPQTVHQPSIVDYPSATGREHYSHTARRHSHMSQPDGTQPYSPISPQGPNEDQYVEYHGAPYEEQQVSAFFWPQDHYGYQQWSSTPV